MVDVAVSTQLQQWAFQKEVLVRPECSASSASSPDLSHHEPETLRIDAAAVKAAQSMDTKGTRSFQERYMSSEEDLSPVDGNSSESEYDSDASIHDFTKECFKARKMSISRWDKGRSCDMAVTVSYVSAGRPKMIELATVGSPIREAVQRSASLAQLPIAAINKLQSQEQQTRRSLMVSSSTSRSTSPAISFESRRPSAGHSPFTHSNKSALQLSSDSASSFHTASSRSASPSVSDHSTTSTRPVSAAATLRPQPRSSLYLVSSANNAPRTVPFPPLTPQSPESHSFLNSDPYGNSVTNAASSIIKSSPHKRLRSISQKLSLAKIAITPSTKKWDSRISGRAGNMPPTPATPFSPMTPQTVPAVSNSSPMNKLRRNSRILSRPPTQRGPSPEIPPVPTLPAPSPRKPAQKKMVARGASNREPLIELPPFPVDDGRDAAMGGSLKSRRVRKRKSFMDLL